jgi:lipopolysaccharide biosynthesis glycosyltransferase
MPSAPTQQIALAALGLSGGKECDYINTGMILADIQTWREIGPAAAAYYAANPSACRYYDQCALNAVLAGRIDHAPQRFNALRFYMPLPVFQELDPAIIHYCYRPKPWDGPIAPWGASVFKPYQHMAQRLAGLGLPWVRRPWWEMAAHDVRARTRRPFADPIYRERLQAMIRAG